MLMIKDGGISCSEANVDMFLWKVNLSLAKILGGRNTFPVVPLRLLHVSFSNTPLAHLSVNTRLPRYYFKRSRLFALTTNVAILMRWRLLMTPQAILVPNARLLTLFSIPESNRLGLPSLLIMVQSPSLHLFSQLLTVVLIREYFGYLVVNVLIANAEPKSLTYRPTSFLIFARISTWYFSDARMSFASPPERKQAPQR